MNKDISAEDRKIFFEDLRDIQDNYNSLIITESFQEAEKYKMESMKKYIEDNMDKLLVLRAKLLKAT